METSLLSILIPVYNECECLEILYEQIEIMSHDISCEIEILFVNDGSVDNTLELIKFLQMKDNRINYVDLSRNFGKEIAMCAGIDYISGDTLVIVDADLQDPPALIPQMLREIKNGYDDVYAYRTNRKGETWLKRKSAHIYYKLLKNISNIPIQENTGDFRMFSTKAITALRKLKENERNMKGLFSYIGFNKKAIFYERDVRYAGKTKWNYLTLLNLAIKGLTSFSIIPLRIISMIGVFVSLLAFVYLSVVIVKALIWGNPVIGYPSLMSTILFFNGIIIIALGVLGEYLGIIYNETKKRPVYYINEYKSGKSCHM